MHVNYILCYISIGCELYTQFIYKLYIIFIFKYRKSFVHIYVSCINVLIYSYCFSAFYFHLIIYAATLSTQDIQISLTLSDDYGAGHCGDGLMTFLSTLPLMGIWLMSNFSLLYRKLLQTHELFLLSINT